VSWHGIDLDTPQWNDPAARVLAFTLAATDDEKAALHVMLNLSDRDVSMELPPPRTGRWQLAIDTGLSSPQDSMAPDKQTTVTGNRYPAHARSVVVLERYQTL